MKNKQILGIIVAGIVFTAVCSFGVYTNYLREKGLSQEGSSLTSTLLDSADDYSLPMEPYVGLLKVEGTIMDVAEVEGLFSDSSGYNHQKTLQYIDDMMYDENNKGILMYVNSPGGGVYESDELYLKLAEYKAETERPIWTYMGANACSGGYYVAMASDRIEGNRNGWTGSIGVIINLMNLQGLYEKLGIQEINIASGANKAMGSAGEELTQEQSDILQGMVDEAYGQFLEVVAGGRNMGVDQVRTLADGRLYTMSQARENGLVDDVAEYQDTRDRFLGECGDVILHEPNTGSDSWWSPFLSSILKVRPKSDAELLTAYLERKGNGVPMYYAEP